MKLIYLKKGKDKNLGGYERKITAKGRSRFTVKLWVRGQKHAETCLERCRVFLKTWYLWFSIKRFYATGLFPYLLKTLENLRFSKVPGAIEKD